MCVCVCVLWCVLGVHVCNCDDKGDGLAMGKMEGEMRESRVEGGRDGGVREREGGKGGGRNCNTLACCIFAAGVMYMTAGGSQRLIIVSPVLWSVCVW